MMSKINSAWQSHKSLAERERELSLGVGVGLVVSHIPVGLMGHRQV